MPVHTPAPGAVIAITAEDDRYAAARRAAFEVAAEQQRPLILYDWDAPSMFAEPLPSWWSSEGWDRSVPDRLDAAQLDAAGRSKIAGQVREAAAAGIDAFAWLPSERGPAALADYANGQGASVVVVPRELEELGGLEAILRGSVPVDALEDRAAASIIVA